MPSSEFMELVKNLSEDNYDTLVKFAVFLVHSQGTQSPKGSARLGTMKGMFTVPDDIDSCNDEIAELFGVEE